MGRRKIEIRAIKDDRNRSVTFLKRKGGLFKKAHELSVLCSVDVAVIIFGHNKKLYEFSSGDINETLRRYQYYGPPHEHKGPGDFRNKNGGGGDDDDEEEEDEEASMHNEEASLPQPHPLPLMAQHLQHHNSFQHIRGPGSSASPPMPNGLFQPRTGTPGPSSIGSRPSSRNTVRRPSSNLIPMQHPHVTPPQPQNGFAYAPNPPIYAPQPNVVVAPPHPSPQPSQYQQYPQQSHTPQPQHQQFSQQSHTPQPQQQQFSQQSHTPQPQQQQFSQHHTPQPQHQQLPQNHQPYIQEPQHTPQPPGQRNDSLQPPPQPVQRTSPQPQQQEFSRPDQATPPQIKQLSSKSRSIFTPIDEGGSILAQHFFGAPDPPRRDTKKDSSPDPKAQARLNSNASNSKPIAPPARPSKSSPFKPPARTDTGGSKSGARPKLNLTIPSESSDNEDSASPQAMSALNSANPAREHHGIKLPPPSPSASAVLSAGASGPPNPFARPPPPTSNQNGNSYSENRNNNNNNNNNLETPISALPSRYMDRELLASPGGIFGSSWDNFNSNILPSPNIATPAEARIPGGAWGRPDVDNEKRKADDLVAGDGKRVKT